MNQRAGTWLLAAIFVLSLPAVTPRIYASDEAQYFAYLRSLWFDHDVSFENEYRHFYEQGIVRTPGFRETFLERETEAGRRINFATLGCAILWSPFYGLADLLVALRGAEHGWARDGFSPPYVAAVACASALYGFLALLLAARVARLWVNGGMWPALLVWVGTPLLFYMYVAPPMSHACSAFVVALFIAVWLRVREHWSAPGLVTLGAVAGLMAMVREQDAFFVIGPLVDFLRTWMRSIRGSSTAAPAVPPATSWSLLRNAALGAIAGAIVYAPQALAYEALNGYPGPSRLVSRKMTWTAPHFLEVLFSPEHGFFFWTPLALAAIAGLLVAMLRRWPPPARRDLRFVAACLLTMVLAQVYVAGSVESWTVAGAFGQRRFIGLTAILVFGLAVLGTSLRGTVQRSAAVLLAGFCVVWNLGLLLQFGAGLMDRQRLEPWRNAYVTFVVLPGEAPALAARYVFARDSFYRKDR